tara:strand:+ start:43 stop:234 length:192 start_codon:yes stop_codon:yes gene_type:complete
MPSNHIHDQVSRGLVGTVAPILGLLASRMDQIEQAMKIASLGLGCCVSIAMLCSIIHHWKDKK